MVVAVNRIFPKVDELVNWLTCVHLLPCRLQCVEWIEKWEMESEETGKLLNNVSNILCYQALYSQALPIFKRALAIQEKVLDEEHPDVATSLNNLATLYHSKGEYDQVLPLCQRALVIYQQKLPDHPWKRKCEENYAKCLKEYLKNHRSVGRFVSRILKWFKWG